MWKVGYGELCTASWVMAGCVGRIGREGLYKEGCMRGWNKGRCVGRLTSNAMTATAPASSAMRAWGGC